MTICLDTKGEEVLEKFGGAGYGEGWMGYCGRGGHGEADEGNYGNCRPKTNKKKTLFPAAYLVMY